MATDHQHTSPIKTPKQLVVVVLLAFLVPVTLIVLISQLVMSGHKGARDTKADESRLLERIQPVGAVMLADASAPRGNLTGTQVYEAWLIIGKNAPQPIGQFAVGSSGAGTLSTRATTAPPRVGPG